MRYLGLDYGTKTLGLSISDESGLIASNIGVIRYENIDALIIELTKVINEYKVNEIVLGLPLNMDGSESARSKLTREFGDMLIKEFNINVNYQDERFSTVEAKNLLISNKTRRDKRKKVIDSIAGTIILQTFLDKKKRNHE